MYRIEEEPASNILSILFILSILSVLSSYLEKVGI